MPYGQPPKMPTNPAHSKPLQSTALIRFACLKPWTFTIFIAEADEK
jgi:hypothetical protein